MPTLLVHRKPDFTKLIKACGPQWHAILGFPTLVINFLVPKTPQWSAHGVRSGNCLPKVHNSPIR